MCDFSITNSREIITINDDGIRADRNFNDVEKTRVRIIYILLEAWGLGVAKSIITIDGTTCI